MEPSFIEAGRWIRGDEDLALRIRIGDPRKSLSGGVAVEPGVAALILGGEGPAERLAPGDYSLEALLALPILRSGGPADLVLVRADPAALPFVLREVAGKHGGTATLSFVLVVEIASVPKLVFSLLREPGRAVKTNLGERLHSEVRAAADAVLGRESLTPELDPARVAAMLEATLTSVGAKVGLRVTRVEDVRVELGAGAAAAAAVTEYGEVALSEEPGEAPELATLESTPLGTRRDWEREQQLAQAVLNEGISLDALAGSGAAAPPARSVPTPSPTVDIGVQAEAQAEAEGIRCPGCGTLQATERSTCRQCATPLG